jgi:hypothetical protein
MDESRKSWNDGVSHCVGVKALVQHFEADLHQREQEAIVVGQLLDAPKRIRHKPFYAVEVKLVDLRLRTILATFSEPTKSLIDLGEAPLQDRFENVKPDDRDLRASLSWYDFNDFVETDWKPTEDKPKFCTIEVAACPRFSYFRRTSGHEYKNGEGLRQSKDEKSRFGNEDTHVCIMGKEPCRCQHVHVNCLI